MPRSRVLIVEDRPGVLTLMTTVLERGHEVVSATDGAAALAVLASSPPLDVVLTDIRMPGANGFEVLRAVRERAPGTEVVMMTAYANVADAVAAIQLGAFDYVAKPIDADEIGLVVARAVEHRQLASGRGAAAPPAGHRPLEGEDRLTTGYRDAVERARARASREYLIALMERFDGNVTQAARRAAMTRESLHRVLRKYGVRGEERRDDPSGDAAHAERSR